MFFLSVTGCFLVSFFYSNKFCISLWNNLIPVSIALLKVILVDWMNVGMWVHSLHP